MILKTNYTKFKHRKIAVAKSQLFILQPVGIKFEIKKVIKKMNAFEIINNIIIDGIEQSKLSIWKRLLIPDFDVPNPKNNDNSFFEKPIDYLDSELKKLANINLYFEREYYATRPLMSEKEYGESSFTQNYKYYVPDYHEYKQKWNIDKQNILKIENSRKELNDLLNLSDFIYHKFAVLNLSETTKNVILGNPFDRILLSMELSKLYEKSRELWEKSRTDDGKQNVLINCEKLFFFRFHKHSVTDFTLSYKKKEINLRLNYVELWKELKTSKENEYLEWLELKNNHIKNQNIRKEEIDKLQFEYNNSDTSSIIKFNEQILKNSQYNFNFSKSIEIDYNPTTRILLIEYTLPNIENIPNIKETKYLTSKREFKDIFISKNELNSLFDSAIYNITLRCIYEVFENNSNIIDAVNFNGWIKTNNKATGINESNCIVSIQVKRDEFSKIQLQNVDAKTCFKHFKGIGSSKLFGITPIQPILQIQSNDKRFVDSYKVNYDNHTNLASMAWEDFEHLIRELFEKEFSSKGGEVKVTQASRDGGVDAIAFDPDPIRGGKFVIQAKRYTNTVGVSAVRDLYGTLLNEGANKGILVTTSDYGPDSYEFSKGKPITLLNGANLLYLLEKHGTRAKIDIREARMILGKEK